MMMRAVVSLIVFAIAARGTARTAQEGNPVQKVIDLLERMQGQIQTEGKEEAAAYDKFACFCKDQADDKLYRITKGKEKIEMLSASIELLEAEIKDLDDKTDSTKQSIDDLTKEMEDNDSQREEDFAAFSSDYADLQDAIERIEEAIADMSGSKDNLSGSGVKKLLIAKASQVSPADADVIAEVDQALKVENQTEAKKAAMLAQGSTISSTGSADQDSLSTAEDMTKSWQTAKDWRRRSLQLISTGSAKPTKEQAEVLLQWASSKQPAFEFSSNKHIEVVKDLLKAYKQQKYERETQEAGDKHKYNMLKQSNQHNLDSLNDLKTKLETTSASKTEEKGNQEKEREETQADVDADQSFLDDLTAECEKKAEAWDARSHVRSNELTAIAECLSIMKKGVTGKYGANSLTGSGQSGIGVGLVAVHTTFSKVETEEDGADDEVDEEDEAEDGDAASFLQRRKKKNSKRLSGQEKTARKQRVMELLAKKGRSLKDAILSSLAFKVREDNFGEVKKLIGDLIQKLKDEGKAAEEESQWCKDELEAATTKREENSANIDKETSAITLGKAKIETLKGEVKVLSEEISELYKALNEQTQLREQDHVDNDRTLEETRAGLAALTAAKEVLETFYNDPTALLQRKQKGPDADGNSLEDLAPESDSFSGDYQGKQEESGGIISLLTTIGGDFERTIKSTEQAEKDNEDDFQTFKSETEGDIDEKKGLVDTKEGEITTTEGEVEQDTEDLADAKEMKANAITELEKLEPVCLDSGASFQERKKRREQEIAALEEAMKIIDEL